MANNESHHDGNTKVEQIEAEAVTTQSDTVSEVEPLQKRPDVFQYTDYKAFLRDILKYYKTANRRYSLRRFSREAGISSGYLSIIFHSSQQIAPKTLDKIIPHLQLSPSEISYLKVLRDMAEPKSAEHRAALLKKLTRFQRFQTEKTPETEMVGYLEKWYRIAIRELAADPDFRLDPAWIQDRLEFPVKLVEIRRSLDFLLSNGFLKRLPENKARVEAKRLNCDEEIYSLALAKSHQEFLKLASSSLEVLGSEDRSILGHSMALDSAGFKKAKQILDRALEEIANLENQDGADLRVYNFALTGFALTRKKLKEP